MRVGDNWFVRAGDPPTVTVAKGTRVRWRWTGSNEHNVAAVRGPAEFRSGRRSSGTFSPRLRRRGTYRIVCTIHRPLMRMRLKVD